MKEKINLFKKWNKDFKNYSFFLNTVPFSWNPLIVKATISPTEILILGVRKVIENHKNTKLVQIVELSDPESLE